ncbi:hypothetical protein EDD11_006957 [Mortierella claussenii]|nr:hypothetical protein EDD11_006957 [Mortierella claussenii]
MTVSRASSSSVYNVAHLRFVSNIISWFIPLRMMYLNKNTYHVQADVAFKVHLDTLLQPERETLRETRMRLGLDTEEGSGRRRNPLDPSSAFLRSFLPGGGQGHEPANLPEESGVLDQDGSYIMRGEWIEALEDSSVELNEKNGDERPRSNVVLLYAHGGGHVFCSAKFHRQLVTRMLLEFGPGARAFVMEYRLAPEDPFPAAIHDAYAAYLYLTQPSHEAITLQPNGSSSHQHPHERPVDPKDIVLAGDSAGAGVAIALQLYLRDYVQPSVDYKVVMPPATVLISFNFARNYLCGDSQLVPNERNSGGKAMEWEWYRHLAQHPLVSPVYTADLSCLESSTLLQTGTFDRLADDTRLYAHKLGQANPDQRVRLELYHDMVHVHQFFEFLPMATYAIQSMVRFVEDVQGRSHRQGQDSNRSMSSGIMQAPSRKKDLSVSSSSTSKDRNENSGTTSMKSKGTEWVVIDTQGRERSGHDDNSNPIEDLETYWSQPERREV